MNQFIAKKLRTMVCPYCGKHPSVSITSDGLDIASCGCDEFVKSLHQEI
jgi:formate dehydrogenase maturation protein FdhE